MSVNKIATQSTLHNLDINTQKIIPKQEVLGDNLEKIHKADNEVLTREEIGFMINSINAFLKPSNTHIKFELHEELNEYYVKVVDDYTKEVIREIPSKKWLDIYASMTEFLGLIIDKKI
ncbi:flagellar protein FlaG [Metabacillus crassostreae]|uniref:flagellar protein FlaG n=1 Tax=Metabacillus crassostreae TaxID=929098 RepID=UPI0019595D49|nr:flagellar protein FlaG [Metabacillus crassostreae]MBM7606233.1 flagellar protein FlaG [Metabacillus crassostreae]